MLQTDTRTHNSLHNPHRCHETNGFFFLDMVFVRTTIIDDHCAYAGLLGQYVSTTELDRSTTTI